RHECRSPRTVFGHDTPGLAQGDTGPNGAGPGGNGPSKGRGKPLAAVGAFVGPTRRRIGRLSWLSDLYLECRSYRGRYITADVSDGTARVRRSFPKAAGSRREPRPSTSGPSILVVVTRNFLHEHHDPAPQGRIINSHERSHQP